MDSRAFKILEKALKGTKLELRSMSLVGANLQPLIDFLLNKNQLRSISLSYNPQLGGSGITELVHHLPSSITEIGLVDCGFGDVGATALLDWMKNAPQLRMACIEYNNFSSKLQQDFSALRKENPQLVLIT